MMTRLASFVLALILVGCSQKEVPAPGKVDYLWTVPSPQGESALGPQSQPGPEQPLYLRVATDSHSAAVLVATFQGRDLSMAPPPVLVRVPANSEKVIEWKLPTGRDPSKIFTAFLPADGESSREMEALQKQWDEQKGGQGPAAQRLYECLSEWAGEDRTGSASAGHQVVELGPALTTGLMTPEGARLETNNVMDEKKERTGRTSDSFQWRKNSRQVAFAANVHPVVIYDFASASR